jgi:threonine/homoserine/homoserine lactone efflux protein
MTVVQALLAFTVAAGLLTLTPGLDTALVLRTSALEGRRQAMLAALGVGMGCLVWGAASALGLSALLAASQTAFAALKWMGAAYLVWLGLGLILRPRQAFEIRQGQPARAQPRNWLARGLLTNLLNPKIGVFYISFLPQFLPPNVEPAPFIFLLACVHVVLGLLWFALLISATKPLSGLLQRSGVAAWLDRATGAVMLAFGLKLALERR